ncbi:MAG: cytochrome c3 family protein [Thermodesulfobacteriota bacterium]|nr:cytochrome c3 family protein [Thermodesulfobacteriota bacterium]
MKTHILYLVAVAACLTFGISPVWAMEAEDCLACHSSADDVGEDNAVDEQLFNKTAHADEGCTACHEIGDEHPYELQSAMGATCVDCHYDIGETYAASAHGENATCVDCHNPHKALAPVNMSGTQMNAACLTCHETADMESVHDRWLPQTDLHLASVACVSCHSSTEKLAVTLYVTRRLENRTYADYEIVDYAQLQQLVGTQSVTALLDAVQDGEISLDEMATFYAGNEESGLRLQAMMTPETVDHDFRTIDNRFDCTYCHAAGPESMQDSYVAFPQQDGTFKRLPLEKGATIDVLFGTPDFYMVGATRSKVMDILGLLILLGGLALPVGHGTMRFLTRKNRRKEH